MVRRHKVKIAKSLRHRSDHCEKNVRDPLDFLQWSGWPRELLIEPCPVYSRIRLIRANANKVDHQGCRHSAAGASLVESRKIDKIGKTRRIDLTSPNSPINLILHVDLPPRLSFILRRRSYVVFRIAVPPVLESQTTARSALQLALAPQRLARQAERGVP
jgi:hypothetical protein